MSITLVRSAAIAAGVLTGIFGPVTIDSGRPGLGTAQAREYYTKKRVNGRWINGRFAKRSAAKAKVPARETAAPAARDGAAPQAAPAQAVDARPSSAAAVAPAVAATPPLAATPGLAAPRPALWLARTEASGPSPAPAPSSAAALAEEDRMRRLQEALQARMHTLLVTSLAASHEPFQDPSSHSAKLQEALQARSHAILITSLADAAPAMDLSGPSETASLGPLRASPGAELRSVTFDFVSGVKTTVFGDGTTATEPFDPKLLREVVVRRSLAIN